MDHKSVRFVIDCIVVVIYKKCIQNPSFINKNISFI